MSNRESAKVHYMTTSTTRTTAAEVAWWCVSSRAGWPSTPVTVFSGSYPRRPLPASLTASATGSFPSAGPGRAQGSCCSNCCCRSCWCTESDLWIESLTPPVSASLLPLTAGRPVVGLVQMLRGADISAPLPTAVPGHRAPRCGSYRHFVVLNDVDRGASRDANPRASIGV